MKPEEAIDTINSIKHIIDIDNYSDRVEKALDMAIEALKEQGTHSEWLPMITKDDYGEQVLGYKCKTVVG